MAASHMGLESAMCSLDPDRKLGPTTLESWRIGRRWAILGAIVTIVIIVVILLANTMK